jgi:hypothetical protein
MNLHADNKNMIRSILKGTATKGRTITYSELGRQIGRHARGPWPELDTICEEDNESGRPDLTLCVVLSNTGMAAKYLQQSLKLSDGVRITKYFNDLEQLYAHYKT